MRTFIVLCLIAAAWADKLGYNYKPVPHSESGLSFAPGASYTGHSLQTIAAPTHSAPVENVYTAPAELEKEFFTFTANDADFDDVNAAQRVAGAVKQGLRVIFIKGPENHAFEEAALALAKQSSQQQTAIYVLNKQADIGELANKLNAANRNVNHKPEVHFVKYRTAEDASNAQKAIQSQYDSLGGKTNSINGGIAPVINFASQAAVRLPVAQQPASGYLPSSLFRLRV